MLVVGDDDGSGSRICRKSFYFSSSRATSCLLPLFSLVLSALSIQPQLQASLFSTCIFLELCMNTLMSCPLSRIHNHMRHNTILLLLLALTLNSLFHSFILFFRRTLVEYHFMLRPGKLWLRW